MQYFRDANESIEWAASRQARFTNVDAPVDAEGVRTQQQHFETLAADLDPARATVLAARATALLDKGHYDTDAVKTKAAAVAAAWECALEASKTRRAELEFWADRHGFFDNSAGLRARLEEKDMLVSAGDLGKVF